MHPIRADAHQLPFSAGFFDAVVSIGAYNYFGTGADYLGYVTSFLRAGGSIGIVVPGVRQTAVMPAYLAERWGPDLATWLPPDWWREHWARSGLVSVDVADAVPHSWSDWLHWLEVCATVGRGYEPDERLLASDQGRLLGLARVVGHICEGTGHAEYDD